MASASVLSKEVVLKASDQTIATNICLVAATKGMKIAATVASENDINFRQFKSSASCNGLSLANFATKFRQYKASKKVAPKPSIILMANNTDIESQLCLDAVTMGERKARAKHSVIATVLCNHKDLPDFVRSFNNQDVTIKKIANESLEDKIALNK